MPITTLMALMAVSLIVLSLAQLARLAPVDEPAAPQAVPACDSLAGLPAEAVRECLTQWTLADRRDLVIDAASRGPAPVRMLALETLAAPPAPHQQSLMIPLGSPPTFAPDERDRLLASIVDLLSASGTMHGEAVDREALHRYLWEFSGQQMPLAVAHAEAIAFREGRFLALRALASADRGAYVAARRPVQLIVGLALVLAAAAAARFPRYRRPAGALAASAALWTLWSMVTQDASELPPGPYMFVTAGFIAFMTGGLTVAMAATLRRTTPGAVGALVRVVLLGLAAGIIALVLCGWTYSAGIVPEAHDGWSAMLAPLASGMMAGLWGSVLALADVLLSRRTARPAAI